MLKIISFGVFLIFIVACQKAENRACWKSVGKDSFLEIEVSTFNKLKLHEHLQYVLVQDTVEKIVVFGGENLLNFVKTDVTDSLLDISNENKCNFLRSYKKKLKVEIHFKELINIHFEGTDSLTNIGKLEFGWLTFLIRDGAGSVKLNFNADYLHATISHGWGDFKFTGTTNKANLYIQSNGYCDTYGLEVMDSLTVVSKSQGATNINANGAKLKAQIDADGDILYKGTPLSIKLNRHGNGELVNAN